MQGNYQVQFVSKESFSGLESIQKIIFSFYVLYNFKSNCINIVKSLSPMIQRSDNSNRINTSGQFTKENIYFKSIYLFYPEKKIDCFLTLFFMMHNLHLNLFNQYDGDLFFQSCFYIDLFNIKLTNSYEILKQNF